MAVNLTGFTNALIQALEKEEGKPFHLVDVSWDQLYQGLEEQTYAGAFTTLDPTVITEGRYTFSNPFLLLGPVLVVPSESDAHSLADLGNTTIGAYAYDESVLIIQRYPSILIQPYEQITMALEEVATGQLAGALVPNLEARALIGNLYTDRLKIVTLPLSNKGLRLITLKGRHPSLIEHFNKGLEALRKNGTYQELRDQFGVK